MCAIVLLDLRVFFPKNHTFNLKLLQDKIALLIFLPQSCGIKNGAAVTLAANIFRHCNTFDDYKESSSSEPTLAHAAQCCICENLRALRNIVFELKKRAYLYLNVVDVAFFSYFFQYVWVTLASINYGTHTYLVVHVTVCCLQGTGLFFFDIFCSIISVRLPKALRRLSGRERRANLNFASGCIACIYRICNIVAMRRCREYIIIVLLI